MVEAAAAVSIVFMSAVFWMLKDVRETLTEMLELMEKEERWKTWKERRR